MEALRTPDSEGGTTSTHPRLGDPVHIVDLSGQVAVSTTRDLLGCRLGDAAGHGL